VFVPYVELHCHSAFSFLDGASHPVELAAAVRSVAVDSVQAYLARDAFARFGKGRGAAGLSFGDCFSYALARAMDRPLLFKGDDFGQTDLTPALA